MVKLTDSLDMTRHVVVDWNVKPQNKTYKKFHFQAFKVYFPVTVDRHIFVCIS